VVDELRKGATAGASLGGDLGMGALGTILGAQAFVHLLHHITGLPLWLCYATSSAIACGTAAGLLATGVRTVREMDIVPEGTGRVVREAVMGSSH
jgi:hypothetical protein